MTGIVAVVKVTVMTTLGLMAIVESLFAASDVQALNTVLNFASLVILVAGIVLAPRAFRARTAEMELREKDRIIQTKTQFADAMEERAEAATMKAAELGALLDEARRDSASWQGRYEEQERYTAGPALLAITQLLDHTNREAERRHKEILLALRALRTLGTAAPVIDDD